MAAYQIAFLVHFIVVSQFHLCLTHFDSRYDEFVFADPSPALVDAIAKAANPCRPTCCCSVSFNAPRPPPAPLLLLIPSVHTRSRVAYARRGSRSPARSCTCYFRNSPMFFVFAPDSHPLRASQPPHSGPAAHHERCAEASDGRNCNAQKQARHTPTPTTHFTGLNPQSPSGTRLHATRPIASPTS